MASVTESEETGGSAEQQRDAKKQAWIEAEYFSDEKLRSTNFVYYHKVVEAIMPYIPELTAKLPVNGGHFVLADYGANDGSFTLPIVTTVTDHLKARHGSETYVCVYYEDLPDNDFSHLFNFVNPRLRQRLMRNVLTFASGTSFYQQVLPPASVHLGVCTSAIHWLSSRPCVLQNSIFISQHSGTSGSVNDGSAVGTGRCYRRRDSEYKLYSEQAACDLEQFLEQRAREIVPGGFLIVTSPYEHEDSNFLQMMDEEWRKCLQEGIISQAEFVATNLAKYFRSEEELLAPVRDASTGAYRLGLRAVAAHSFSCKMHDSGLSAPEQLLAGIRSFTAATLWHGLLEERAAADKQRVVDTLYARLLQDLRDKEAAGGGHWGDVFRSHVVIYTRLPEGADSMDWGRQS